MTRLNIRIMPTPRQAVRRYSQRDRLLRALQVVDRSRWPMTWEHLANQLVEHEAGRLPKPFSDE